METAGFLQVQDCGAAADRRDKALILFVILSMMNRAPSAATNSVTAMDSEMKWLPPRRGDIAAVIVFALLVAAYVGFVSAYPSGGLVLHRGFGPEWNCTKIGRGEPVCIKKSP